jgi:hypothetical protein
MTRSIAEKSTAARLRLHARGEQVDDHNRDQQQAGSSAHGSSDSVSGTARW